MIKRGRKQLDAKKRLTKGVSFNAELLERLDRWVAHMNKNTKGVSGLTRSKVINSLIEDFLAEDTDF